MTYTSNDVLFIGACLTYILTGVFCATVRWFHMCKPYDLHKDDLYPARTQISFFYLALVLQFPYLLNPCDENIWTYTRIVGLLYYPVCFSLLFRRYFRDKSLRVDNFTRFFFCIPFFVIMVLLFMLFYHKGTLINFGGMTLYYIMGGLSILLTLELFHEVTWLRKKINRFHQDNFSSDDDFPYPFAKRVAYHPFFWIAIMWVIFVTGNHWVKFFADLFCSVWMMFFLLYVLPPQKVFSKFDKGMMEKFGNDVRKLVDEMFDNEIDEADNDSDEKDYEASATDFEQGEYDESISQEVLNIVLEKFKEPHLQKPDLLACFPRGMKKEANAFIMQVGYYNLVNMFRLKYAQLYKEAYPNATQEDVALISGFTSRYTYYKARKTVTVIDSELVEKVTLNS